MQSQPRELRIYETEQGDVPFSSWLDALREQESEKDWIELNSEIWGIIETIALSTHLQKQTANPRKNRQFT